MVPVMIRLSSISSVLPYWFVGRRSRKTTCGIGGSKLFAWIWVDHGRSAFTMRVWVWQSYWYVLMPPAELVIFLLWFIAIGGFSHHSHTHTHSQATCLANDLATVLQSWILCLWKKSKTSSNNHWPIVNSPWNSPFCSPVLTSVPGIRVPL